MDILKLKTAVENVEKHLSLLEQALTQNDYRRIGAELFHLHQAIETLKDLSKSKKLARN